jgi:hypothetical protein
MNDKSHEQAANEGGEDDFGGKTGVTLEDYASATGLPLHVLEKLGVRTVENPWNERRKAVAIPYRLRDGSVFRDRIWQAVQSGESKARRAVWDRRENKLGGLLYGLDLLPGSGCPILLVDDESACHVLWHYGFDAVGIAGPNGYYARRDDAELEGLKITVLAGTGAAREDLLKRLSASAHRHAILVASLADQASIVALHRDEPARFAERLNTALAAAEPLENVLAREPAQDVKKPAKSNKASDGTVADNLVKLARSGARFFCAPDETGWGAIAIDGRREVWSLRSKGFRKWLIRQYYETSGRAPTSDGLTQALLTLDAVARYDGEQHPVFVRTAGHGGKYYIDLADKHWRAVEIDDAGWRVVTEPPVYFQRPRGMLPLPEPVPGGSLRELRGLLNLSTESDFTLIVAWLLAALRPNGPYPLLAIAGEPGASKSTAARVLRSLVDPNVAPLRAAPREERDCWIAANNAGLLAFDNLSGIPAWLSDALCRVATGGGFAIRQLHTDDDEMLFDAIRPTLLTAVGDVIARSDLADRAIMIELPTIGEAQRIDEESFYAGFEAARPRILGALLDAMVLGLRNRANVKLEKLPRLADFAVWVTACEPAFTHPGGFMDAYSENAAEAVSSVIEGDAVCIALLSFLAAHGAHWIGKPKDLLAHLNDFAPEGAKRERYWPRNPQNMSSRLTLAAPSLRKIGVTFNRCRSGNGRCIRIIKE